MNKPEKEFTYFEAILGTIIWLVITYFAAHSLFASGHPGWAVVSILVAPFIMFGLLKEADESRERTEQASLRASLRAPFQNDIYLNDLTDQMVKAVEAAHASIKSLSPDAKERLRRIMSLESAGYDYIDELHATTPHDPLWSSWQQQRVAWRKLFEHHREALEKAVAQQKETKR